MANSSLSMRPVGNAAQFTLIRGRSFRGLLEWMARAMSSLPVPVSPRINTDSSTMNRSDFAPLGFGVGLRRPHYVHILEQHPPMDWFEVISENFMVGGAAAGSSRRRARALSNR
jgi:hypothetical protein